MKTKLLSPWNVKVGDTLVIEGPHGGKYESKIIQINKGRAHFFRATKWEVVTAETICGFKSHFFYGRFVDCGKINAAEKLAIKA